MPSQSEIVATVVPLLAKCSQVQGVALGGSLGRGTATEWSDVDLFVLVDQVQLDNVTKSFLSAVSRRMAPLAVLSRGFVEDMGFLHQFIFSDASMLDVAFITDQQDLPFGVQPTLKLLFDRSGHLTRRVSEASHFADIPDKTVDEMFAYQESAFVVCLVSCCKSLAKGDRWLSIYNVDRLRNTLFTIMRIQSRNFSPFLRRAEERADVELPTNWMTEVSIYKVSPSIVELCRTTTMLVGLFRRVANPTSLEPVLMKLERNLHSLGEVELTKSSQGPAVSHS